MRLGAHRIASRRDLLHPSRRAGRVARPHRRRGGLAPFERQPDRILPRWADPAGDALKRLPMIKEFVPWPAASTVIFAGLGRFRTPGGATSRPSMRAASRVRRSTPSRIDGRHQADEGAFLSVARSCTHPRDGAGRSASGEPTHREIARFTKITDSIAGPSGAARPRVPAAWPGPINRRGVEKGLVRATMDPPVEVTLCGDHDVTHTPRGAQPSAYGPRCLAGRTDRVRSRQGLQNGQR